MSDLVSESAIEQGLASYSAHAMGHFGVESFPSVICRGVSRGSKESIEHVSLQNYWSSQCP